MADESKISNRDFKLDRSVFLYSEPTDKTYGKPEDYAQCKSCFIFTGEERKRCYVLGKKLEVEGVDTCAQYINGEPHTEFAGKEYEALTPKEAGFEKRLVQCHRCYWYTDFGLCGFFAKLNLKYPEIFDLKTSVNNHGCCNAQTPIGTEFKKEDIFMILNKEVKLKDLFK